MYHGRFTGEAYDIGFHWGKTILAHDKNILEHVPFEITSERIDFAKACSPLYKKYLPNIAEEITGISEGANISKELLDAVLYSMYCFKMPNLCTTIAAREENRVIFGRNSDFLKGYSALSMNCLYRITGSYSFSANTTAFVQMEDGVNEKKLACGLTFIYPWDRAPGINAGMLVRAVLERCATVDEAVNLIESLPSSSTHTIILADSSGEMALVESCAGKNATARKLHDGNNASFIACNDFTLPEMKKFCHPKGMDDWNSSQRYKNACSAIENNEELTIEKMEDILSGKYGFMCNYSKSERADTVWSTVYDLTNNGIYRCEGNPSRSKYIKDERFKLI